MYQDFLPYSLAFKKLQKTVLCVFSSFFILFIGLDDIQSQEKPFVVVLDAGHGGHDSGNRGNGYFEKKIALSIALKIGEILEKINEFKIIYTRKSDVFVGLIERANIANKADADLFVSIHCDAFTSPKAFGAGTFVLGLHENERNFKVAQKENSVIFLEKDYEKNYDGFNPNDPESVISLILMQQTYLEQSIDVASTIQKSFVNNLSRKDRTVKQAGFIVLKGNLLSLQLGFSHDVSYKVPENIKLIVENKVISELKKPGRDPRAQAKILEFDSRLKSIADITVGMTLKGIVTNVTNFGAFINVGIKENGLIHKSNLANTYVEDPSQFIALHEHVEVQVIELDLQRKRIGLKKV